MELKCLTTVLKDFSSNTSKPEEFLSSNTKTHDKFKSSTKLIYDFCKSCENNRQQDQALPELIVKQFDDEQIWQELELQNNSIVDKLVGKVAGLLTGNKAVSFLASNTSEENTKRTKLRKKDEMHDVEEDSDENESDETDDEIDKIKSRLEDSDDGINDLGDDFDDDDDDDDENDFNFDSVNPLLSKGDDEDSDSDENENIDEDKNEMKTKKKKTSVKKPTKGSVVDDRFFKLAEMEAFLDQEDAKEMRKNQKTDKGDKDDETSEDDEDDIDMFADLSSEDEDEEARYDDFFDPPDDEQEVKKKVKFSESKEAESDDDEEEENEEEGEELIGQRSGLFESDSEGEDVSDIIGGQEKSTYEKRQEKLKEKIKKMEEASLDAKTWQLKGEITASTRPENSLLEEHLMYDHIAKIPKVITEETTESLEDLIKQRVKDKAWDDVERKIKPTENPYEYKKRITLDQEKSKLSLGEIYEQEYLKQQKEDEEEKTDPDHEEIKKMMTSLFIKLDALSNFHYTPKPAAPEIKIVSNMPTIAMEEVAPVSVSENQVLAPEEVQDKVKGELKSKSEKTETDKNRDRRLKKKMKRQKQKDKEQREKLIDKLNPGLGNKYSKEKARKELEKQSKMGKGVTMVEDGKKKTKSSLTSSKSFFTQLQEEVTTQIKSKKAEKRKKEKNNNVESKKLKL